MALANWQQRLLPDYLDLLSEIDAAIIRQQGLLDAIAESAADGFLIESNARSNKNQDLAHDAEYDKVKSCIRQLVRDWSDEVGLILCSPHSHTRPAWNSMLTFEAYA